MPQPVSGNAVGAFMLMVESPAKNKRNFTCLAGTNERSIKKAASGKHFFITEHCLNILQDWYCLTILVRK
jgi:hypothetical protein